MDIVIWVIAGVVVLVIAILAVVLPFPFVPRRRTRPGEGASRAVNDALNEAEVIYRRQPPIG